MTVPPEHLEIHRARWRRAREALGLVDPGRDDFGLGGLGQCVPQLSVRLLILPSDPEAEWVEFDQNLWMWLKGEHENPFEGPPTDWSNTVFPTSDATVRAMLVSYEPLRLDSYIAICRHGGLEMGLGPGGAGEHNGRRVFWLTRIVGRVWAALDLYGQAIERFKVVGPWECSAALLGTLGGHLGNFGEGWAEYPDPRANPRACRERNLFWRREFREQPARDAARDLAFSLGAWIEDSWGMRERRFLARTGARAGQFDWSRYQ